MRILSLCCGAGGIDEGIKQASGKTTLAIDNWLDACKTMKLNHDCEVICGGILDHEDSFGKFDVVVGGVPCPEFSPANSNRTFDDSLVRCFWRIVEKTGAKYWLMENVPDVIKVCKRRNLLIDCADYGTPQHRVRRFFTNLERPFVSHGTHKGHDLFGGKMEKWVSIKVALGLDGLIQDRKTTFDHGWRSRTTDRPSFTLLTDARTWYISRVGFKTENRYESTKSIDEPCDTVLASADMQLTNYKVYSLKYLRGKNPVMYDKHKPNDLSQPAKTIDTKDRGITPQGMVSDGQYARKLTNEEVAIIQGFPKDYKFYGNKTSVKRQIGNAVPTQPIKAIFEKLLNQNIVV